ncbi:OmpA family protein [uncultured Sphingomonas sp.]|uniref:OmpA family protein n=1 Tax=uncultured Sphingomonas sp. TaxID=158754 RepID=UPI0025E6179B|nr:OmpA family protein [uncultured Sphingomonas sp.]
MRTKMITATLAAAATLATMPAATARDRWDWAGGRPGARDYALAGPGVRLLLPELRGSLRARAWVSRNFDRNRDGLIGPVEAQRANEVFTKIAGDGRARFDWDARDVGWRRPGPAVGAGWDRGAMRGYGFRQTPRGAMLRLQDEVLFATDSATLRPGAVERLRALAGYLRANSGVRVAIEGHTDSRGTDAHNDALSLRRADAVRMAFDRMGVTRARFSVKGFGERQPVASNATTAGMRQNRRVEITLLGRRANEF